MTKVSSNAVKHDEAQPRPVRAEQMLTLLLGYSKLAMVVMVGVFAIQSWAELRALMPRVSKFKALGVEFEILPQLKQDLLKQAESSKAPPANIQSSDADAVLLRAKAVQQVLIGATVLWVDDEPANNLPFRQLLRKLGAGVETARNTQEALVLVSQDHFDLILSDIKRKDDDGLDGLARLRSAGADCPAVFYVGEVDSTRPQPLGALGITNRPDTLLHLVLDGLERTRWSTAVRTSEQDRPK